MSILAVGRPLGLVSQTTSFQNVFQKCSFHLTALVQTRVAGKIPHTRNKTTPVPYEKSFKPDQIGVRKNWNSFNTGGLVGSVRTADTALEDVFIRKFMHGTWPGLLMSEVLIKRRANMIILVFFYSRDLKLTKLHFLKGYTEEIMSYILKCVVRLEPQSVSRSGQELVYKYF